MVERAVRIVEVGPRDGLQAIEETIPTDLKIQLIQRLSKTGLRSIEVTSFTSPQWIPQLADHKVVMQAVKQMETPSISYSVLVPNLRGLLDAAKAGAKEVGVFVSATEGFSRSNNNCSVEEALVRAKQVAEKAGQLGIRVRGYV
jgi:hydroxymethylglutaryl-CoA lyase